MTLLSRGADEASHVHELPDVPRATVPVTTDKGVHVPGSVGRLEPVRDAVASCDGCGRLFVTRLADDGWTYEVQWVPLRWWHRNARRLLRLRSPR